ncbi:TPA: ferredoxin [Candidatus Woesearchaeota archaeon]|nr:ferredoxin [Candidatus Woesearchaeota archaeon]HIG92785.1 ferredoxin [Candidatus Woesearchaeota archaeon]
MAKYKIIYDRTNCIGVGSCAIFADQFWKMNQKDDKADLVGGNKVDDDHWELEFDELHLEEHKEAARSCPVAVIKIVDKEGKEVQL